MRKFLEQNGRCSDDQCGEHHIINWCHNARIEDIQRFVQIIHLYGNKGDSDHNEEPWHPSGKHIRSIGNGATYGKAQGLAGHHREGSDAGAQKDVDTNVGVSMTWCHEAGDKRTRSKYTDDVEYEHGILQHFEEHLQILNLFLLG